MFDGKYIIPVLLAGTIMFLIFLFFIVMYVLIHSRRRQENIAKLARLDLEHKNQLLVTKLEEQECAMTCISREIHDNVSQQTDLLMMYLKALEEATSEQEWGRILPAGKDILSQISNDLRNLSYALNGNYIKLHGLHEVLNKALEYIQRTKQMSCSLRIEGQYKSLAPATELLIYRIAQEALHNATKYSQAAHLDVTLYYLPGSFRMDISDDGVGFCVHSLAGRAPTLGLQNMNQRAELLKASLTVNAAPDAGCKVILQLDRNDTSSD